MGSSALVPTQSPSRPRRHAYSAEERQAMQEKIVASIAGGSTNAAALEAVGIPRQTFSRWRREDEEFGIAVEDAIAAREDVKTERVESTLYDMATSGMEPRATEFYLKAANPHKYGDKLSVEHSLAPDPEQLAKMRELANDPEARAHLDAIARTLGRLDDPDAVIDEAPAGNGDTS